MTYVAMHLNHYLLKSPQEDEDGKEEEHTGYQTSEVHPNHFCGCEYFHVVSTVIQHFD